MKALTTEEREVHMWLDDTDRKWKVEASIPRYIRKFRKMGWKVKREELDESGEAVYALFEAPENMITIRSTTAPKRKAPDALRAAAAERMKQMHKSIHSN